jgi:hypothetical protein
MIQLLERRDAAGHLAPSVRPWKALAKVTIWILFRPPTFTPCVRESLIAHSVVSAPGRQ